MHASELVGRPTRGRVTSIGGWSVRLGDVTTTGRLRLDAIARYLQDAATEETESAVVAADRSHAWVLRRTTIEIGELPRYRDRLEMVTWCSGIGARWAERRTDVMVGDTVRVRAAALWVYVDAATGHPAPLTEQFHALYSEAAAGRQASQRLRMAAPPAAAARLPWPLRRRDFDVRGHMNNAAYLEPLEDLLTVRSRDGAAGEAAQSRIARLDAEWRGGILPDEAVALAVVDSADEVALWFIVNGEARATCRLMLVARP